MGERHGLTPKQRRALVGALEQDYFDVPRETTMGDFAEALGITQQVLSQRIRRGHGILVENALTISPPDEIGIASGGGSADREEPDSGAAAVE